MRDAFARFASSPRPFWLFALAAMALFVALRAGRLSEVELRGDEGTYVAMTASLARDGDLRFGDADAARAAAQPGGATVILQRTPSGVAYSKPVVYPLVAAPFYAVAGERGMVAANALLLVAAFVLAAAFLGRFGDRSRATETVLTFAFASIVVPYAAWRMAESLQVALAAAGLALALAPLRRPASREEVEARGALARLLDVKWAPYAGMLLLGVLVAMREPHAAVALVPVLAALLAGERRRAAMLFAALVVAYLAVVGATMALSGAPSPYKARRATFNVETGYPAGPQAATALERFDADEAWATSSLGLRPELEPRTSAYATLYFFVGRHSGLIAYLPALVVFAFVALRRPDRVTVAALAGCGGLALFFLLWWPTNYFGGETFVGNRYLLAGAPCLLLGLPRLPSRRALALIWVLAAVAGLSALASVRRAAALDPTSQSHTHAGLFRLLPYESIAPLVDGRRDRYWSGDFVRFVDPYARAHARQFELDAGAPAAELELATVWDGRRTTWLVDCDAPDATLVVSDWLDRRRFRLGARGSGSGGPVVVEASPAWRIHPFWWSQGELARARALRFRLESPRPGAKATVRYLGRRGIPATLARELTVGELPAAALAGSAATVPVRLRNTGDWSWSSEEVLPVQVGVRFTPLEPAGVPSEMRFALPLTVQPGESLELPVSWRWPAAAGRYSVTIDLVLEDVAWFGERGGGAAFRGEVSLSQSP